MGPCVARVLCSMWRPTCTLQRLARTWPVRRRTCTHTHTHTHTHTRRSSAEGHVMASPCMPIRQHCSVLSAKHVGAGEGGLHVSKHQIARADQTQSTSCRNLHTQIYIYTRTRVSLPRHVRARACVYVCVCVCMCVCVCVCVSLTPKAAIASDATNSLREERSTALPSARRLHVTHTRTHIYTRASVCAQLHMHYRDANALTQACTGGKQTYLC